MTDSELCACINAARDLSTTPTDDEKTEDRLATIDHETRGAARAFLRSLFKSYDFGGAPGDEDQPYPEDSGE